MFVSPTIMAVQIISLNVNGIRNSDRRSGLLLWLRSLAVVPDVVCLQEAHCVSDVECQSWFRSSGSQKSCGCVILFLPSLSLVDVSSDDAGRFVSCEFRLQDKSFRVVSLYAPNRNPARDQFLEQVSSWVDPSVPTVLCGDFNTVFDRSLDRAGSDASDTSRESSSALLHLFDACCVIDTWRYFHPSSSGFTWMSSDGSVSSRNYLIGCPYVWVPSVSSCDIVPCPYSDHCAVLLRVTVPDVFPPGPGLWKLNISIWRTRNTFARSGSSGLTGVVGSLSFLLLANGGKRASPVLRVYLYGTAVPNSLLLLLEGISFLGFLPILRSGLTTAIFLWLRSTNRCFSSWLTWM